MIGAIAGDIIGSIYEGRTRRIKTEEFPLFQAHSHFTDDTVLTIAVADALLHQGDFAKYIHRYGRRYPDAGYGHAFREWLHREDYQPYNSYGNGSAMRVGPIGWAFNSAETVLAEARRSAAVTHNHPEGIKGSQAVAFAIFLARTGARKEQIRDDLQFRFGYDLPKRWTRSGLATSLILPARVRCRNRSSHSSNHRILKMRSAKLFHLAATAIRWPALPAV